MSITNPTKVTGNQISVFIKPIKTYATNNLPIMILLHNVQLQYPNNPNKSFTTQETKQTPLHQKRRFQMPYAIPAPKCSPRTIHAKLKKKKEVVCGFLQGKKIC
jgi:hypothetical protein